MPTNTSEKDLESLIVADMLASGSLLGEAKTYDRNYCKDMDQSAYAEGEIAPPGV